METPQDEVDLRGLYRDAQQEYKASNFRRALRLYKDLLERGEYEMPLETLFDVREALATCCHSLGRYGDAARYNRKTLKDLEASSDYGFDHNVTIRIRYNLARALTATSKRDRASPKLKEAVSLYRQILEGMTANDRSAILKQTRTSLASALFKLGRYSQAQDLYKQLVQEMEADPKQPREAERLRLQHDYAGTLYHLKRYKKSKKLFLDIENTLMSMSDKQRRGLVDLSRSVDRYVAACVEATDDLDMGVARSMIPVIRGNGSSSTASMQSATAGSRSELQLTLGPENSKSSDEAASAKRRDSRASNRSGTAASTSRARSTSNRTDKRGADISLPASSSVLAAKSTGSTSTLTVSTTGHKARRTRSDQSLRASSKTGNLDPALTRKGSARSSFSSTPPPSSELEKGAAKPPSARRTKSDSSSIYTTSPRDKEASSSPTEISRKAKGLLGKKVAPTELTDSGLEQKSHKDNLSVRSRKSQVPELKLTTPGSWPEETSLSNTDTRNSIPSSSSSQSLVSIPTRRRAVPKDSGTAVKAVTRSSSQGSPSTGNLYALPSGANDADKWFYSLRLYSHTLLCNGVPKNPGHKPVRVAVLDSGFATASDNFGLPVSDQGLRRVKRGHVTYKDFTGDHLSYTDSTKALHGTWCASLLMQTAPNAELYVANVVTPGKKGQKAEHVAAAIAWAIANQVDIISMSFGWENEQEEVDRQIDLARSKGILLFAAASNDGDLALDTGVYPASKHAVYCVYSCSGLGAKSTFNPRSSKPEKSFMFPGENITILGANHKPTKGVQKCGEEGVERRSGTSYATPIAAGTAAMLLDLARQEVTKPRSLEEVERRLKKVEGMSAILLAMSGEPRDGGFYHVRPWKLLGESKPIPSKNNVGETHKWHALMNVLRHLDIFGPYKEEVS
ncbi:hypothetical protein MBLNU13_g10535t1 [Cladosporium sp. NU13]